MSRDEENGYAFGLALGAMLGPLAAVPILLLLGCLLCLFVHLVGIVCLVVVFFVEMVQAAGRQVLSWVTSGWLVPWILVAAQIVVGFLLGFGAGLKVEKPAARR